VIFAQVFLFSESARSLPESFRRTGPNFVVLKEREIVPSSVLPTPKALAKHSAARNCINSQMRNSSPHLRIFQSHKSCGSSRQSSPRRKDKLHCVGTSQPRTNISRNWSRFCTNRLWHLTSDNSGTELSTHYSVIVHFRGKTTDHGSPEKPPTRAQHSTRASQSPHLHKVENHVELPSY
jgi:hypothetical protein